MALITGMHAGSRNELFQNWWRIVLVGFIFLSIGLGIAYQLFLLSRLYKEFLRKRQDFLDAAPLDIKDGFFSISSKLFRYRIEKPAKKPKNFGVYLGNFETPPTIHQIRILSEWDLIIIDPSCPGILEAISSGLYSLSPQILARLDLGFIAKQSISTQIVALTEWITKNINISDKNNNHLPLLTGVCICNWTDTCSVLFLKEFIHFLSNLGFSAYLEISEPEFLPEPNLLELKEIDGLVIRNGTICHNGEEKDAFQMAIMRPTIKAFVTQTCLRSFVVLLWETIDNDSQPFNAVIRRCYQWSKFYSALPWIGTRSSLNIAELSLDQKEPIGAFDWLKKKEVMSIHKKWRSNQFVSFKYINEKSAQLIQIYDLLFIPWNQVNEVTGKYRDEQTSSFSGCNDYGQKFCQVFKHKSELIPGKGSSLESSTYASYFPFGWLSSSIISDSCNISVSPSGTSFDYLGCFPLGINISENDFTDVLQLQHRLRKMKLLDEIEYPRLQEIGENFQQFYDFLDHRGTHFHLEWLTAIQALSQKLLGTLENSFCLVNVFLGLDSGFQIRPDVKFWSVYEFDNEKLYIYLSRNIHQNIEEVILHTFLSSRGFSRQERFQAEVIYAEWSNNLVLPFNLPKRMVDDICQLTPPELLKFFQDLGLTRVSSEPILINLIRAAVERQLLDYPDFLQLKNMSTIGYLSGRVSAKELITARIKWYQQIDCQFPDPIEALENFHRIDISVTRMLKNRKIMELEKLKDNLNNMINFGEIDARIDLIFLSVFCAMRKHAFDEAYIEVTDRNTLLNDQSDQAAAFAELFTTGARCEDYLDIVPSDFGKLLSDRFRTYHHKPGHEPPLWSEKNSKLISTYAAAKIDVSPDSENSQMSEIQRFSFLIVFVVPALLDTLLLTTTGRGLYLSEYMTALEQHTATLALMISLLISGAVGTWVTCGGSYYLISMAFSAMNSFIATRLIGGLAFTLLIGVIGFVSLSISDGLSAGFIFFLYLVALTSYLCLLATLANFQYPGSAFQSGRPLILILVPFLFISPITSIWIPDHDIFIYLTVFYIFLILLLLCIRYIGSKWTTWFIEVESISDNSLKKWYIDRYKNGSEKALNGITELGILKIARDSMIRDVNKFKKSFWKRTDDSVVKGLAKSYDASLFLLQWYSNYTNTPLPIPFSSTWNIQMKVALQTLKQLQSGIKLHNAFIHWRQAGDEVGCNILYFIVALLDKWNAIISGGQLLGLSSVKKQYKLPSGFALAYYLIGAVFLDFNASKLHTLISKGQNMLIGDISSLPEAVKREVESRRLIYWKMLGRYCLFHVWSLAVSCSLIWIFQSTEDSTIIFLAYVGAYTGLLWYQYTKIFSGPRSLKPLIIAVSIGIPLGQILRHSYPNSIYSDVTGLAAATWTAAILSLWFARIKTKKSRLKYSKIPGVDSAYIEVGGEGTYHAYIDPEKDLFLSQDELHDIFSKMRREEYYRVNTQTYPGLEVRSILLHCLGIYRNPRENLHIFALEAFPNATNILELAIICLERGDIIVDCVPKTAIADSLINLKAISFVKNDKIQLIFRCDTINIHGEQTIISNFFQIAAKVVLHAVAENFIGMSHKDSLLTESLLTPRFLTQESEYLNDPSQIENHLRSLISLFEKKISISSFCDGHALKFLSLGLNLGLEWESLPRDIRELVIKRCTGQDIVLTKSQYEWLSINKTDDIPIKTYLARCNFGAYIAISNKIMRLGASGKVSNEGIYYRDALNSDDLVRVTMRPPRLAIFRALKSPFSLIYHEIGFGLKLLAISFVADPELQRELDHALKNSNKIKRAITLFLLTKIWNFSKWLQNILMPMFLLHGRISIIKFWNHIGGTNVSLKRHKITLENTDGHSTAFIMPKSDDGTFEVRMYCGDLDRAPDDVKMLQRVSTYSQKTLALLQLEEFSQGLKINSYEYEYSNKPILRRKISKINYNRYPIRRKCVAGKEKDEEISFNHRGLVESGSYFLRGNIIRFKCYYRKGSNYNDELLRADFVLPHLKCTVSWSVPPKNHSQKLDKWIPHSQIMGATFVIGSDIYQSHWIYDHKFHPTICTTLNGQPIDTPLIIKQDTLGIFKKPINCSFNHDDPLISFRSLSSCLILRLLGLNNHQSRISTSSARSRLWNAWKNMHEFDGVITRWLDERLLRKEPILRTYWRQRDHGNLIGAKKFLNENADSVMAAVDLENSISIWAPLAIKIADLHSFGQGGDANSRTRSKQNLTFGKKTLQVLALDSGTWPNEGGGVSACRRDMVNNLRSVDWYMVAESANDFGLPKHQTEINIHSLKIIPLWGLDFLTPTHGLFEDRLDTEVEHVPRDATKLDIKRNFLPILTSLVKGARTCNFTPSDVSQITRALVKLNEYFSEGKHWGAVWTSTVVNEAWRNLWICPELVSSSPSQSWFQTEIPTIAQLDAALELWFRHLFIFSIPLPEKIPAIFQASHHSVSASYGIVCKIKRNCTLQIWDHAISWREANLYLSSDLCTMAPFIRNCLLGLMRLTSQLILHHADIILPCADFFNPGWEIEIGTNQGLIEHRNIFKRKIDPVVNGITDISKFASIKTGNSEKPTVTMLSHIWYAKDIKTAILAADIIVNEWGITDYRLEIYGAIDKSPSYSMDCFEIIASKSLSKSVVLCGESDPITVLEKTWVFLNSSISEGLPLALGEAALTGVPVVCTDVGASLRVLTDPDTGERYSAVVAPNDARGLALAQINLLAMLDEWTPFANDPKGVSVPSISDKPTREDVEIITARMYEKSKERKALGIKSRRIVQKSFGGDRYLREHEQMLWIGKRRYDLRVRNPCVNTQMVLNNTQSFDFSPSTRESYVPSTVGQSGNQMSSYTESSTNFIPEARNLIDNVDLPYDRKNSSSRTSNFVSNLNSAPYLSKKFQNSATTDRSSLPDKNMAHASITGSSLERMELLAEDNLFYDITAALDHV